jgi:hypothetical protein
MILTHKGMPDTHQTCSLVIVVAIVLLFRQQSSIPATSKVLLQPTISLGIGILWKAKVSMLHANGKGGNVGYAELTLTTDKAQSHRQEHKRMQRRPDDKREPDTEVVNFEDLAAGERQNENAKQFRNSNAREHRSANIDESSPSASRATSTSELAVCALQDRGRRDCESARDVGAEFDGDADADDDVYKGDCVEGDADEAHCADDVDDGHQDGERDGESGGEGAKEDGGEEEDESQRGAD